MATLWILSLRHVRSSFLSSDVLSHFKSMDNAFEKNMNFQITHCMRTQIISDICRWQTDQQPLEDALDGSLVVVAVTVVLFGMVVLSCIVALSVILAGIESLAGIVTFSSASWPMPAQDVILRPLETYKQFLYVFSSSLSISMRRFCSFLNDLFPSEDFKRDGLLLLFSALDRPFASLFLIEWNQHRSSNSE